MTQNSKIENSGICKTHTLVAIMSALVEDISNSHFSKTQNTSKGKLEGAIVATHGGIRKPQEFAQLLIWATWSRFKYRYDPLCIDTNLLLWCCERFALIHYGGHWRRRTSAGLPVILAMEGTEWKKRARQDTCAQGWHKTRFAYKSSRKSLWHIRLFARLKSCCGNCTASCWGHTVLAAWKSCGRGALTRTTWIDCLFNGCALLIGRNILPTPERSRL